MGAYLSSPNTEKDLEDSDAHNTVYGAASMQGWRTSQEDAHNCCPDFDAKTKTTLFAVYDGHGGSEVAQYCAIHLPDFIRSAEAYSAGDLGGALKDAFLDIDSKLTSADVVQELKAIAGLDDDDDDDPEQGDEIAQLRLEAVMPISELMKRYSHDKKEAGSSGDGAGKKQKAQLLSPVTGGRVPNGHGVLAGKLATSSSSSGSSSRQAETGRESGDAAGMQEGEDDDDVFARGKARHGAASAADVHEPPGSGSSSGSGGGGDGGGAAERPAGTAHSSLFASSSGRGGSSSEAPAATTAAAEVDDAGCSSSTADAPDASGAGASVAGLCDSSSEASEAPASGPTAMLTSKADAESGKSGDGSSADEATVCSSSKRLTDLVELPPMCSAADSDSLPSSSGLSHAEDAEGPSCSSSSSYKPLKDEGGSDDSESDRGEAGEEDAWSSNEDDDDDDDDCDDDDDADGDGEGDEDDADDDDDNDENEGATLLRKHMALARTLGEDNEAPGAESGCTACVALIRGGSDIYVANAGDSRCVLSSAGRAIDLSCDHKPDDAHETARIKRAGGHITQDGRVNGGLNLSRAIGDHAYKRNKDLSLAEQMISASPDIMHHKITADDEFLIIACDGIWNSMSSQEVVNFVRERLARPTAMKLSEICSDLFDACLSEDTLGDGTGCDNMTCIIVKLPGGSDRQQQQAGTAAPKRRDSERADGDDGGGREGKRPRVADNGSGCPAPQ